MMRNKICLIIFFACCALNLSAQQEYPKKYYNEEEGWYGKAFAIYLDDAEVEKFTNDLTSQKGRWITKLSKKNAWLSWQALNEWELIPGENYVIICGDDGGPEVIFLLATIEEDGSFIYIGKVCNANELDF
ncbi:MAG: hypothetical protein ACTTKH_06450 [Treponema sp.]